ncbi:gamma carbonic anhydrase family protein [Microbacterium sp. 10M-3C3]|uniref:gamma carbonic anhydrase family protein n=1 Tax=Microbacterium sp. 10M-3C3 TaxID=2483401 RepID=UPI000F634A21|nr:gamma carbonic anhydrase family protein [Microbacterium sp. 10M-3C3]
MEFEHLGVRPRIHPDAVVSPSAVISGDVEIGGGCQILHGAVITSEGGAVTLGTNVIVMENALIRATATNPVHIGDHVLVGPMARLSGATVEDEVFLATGTRVFNERHEEIWAAQRELDFPGYVFGLDRDTPDLMVQLTERYGRSLARHAHDRRTD